MKHKIKNTAMIPKRVYRRIVNIVIFSP